MMDWDNIRYFLAVAREGSVSAAAERLEVNHSTVLRRIAQLEESLGAQMFEKLPSRWETSAPHYAAFAPSDFRSDAWWISDVQLLVEARWQ